MPAVRVLWPTHCCHHHRRGSKQQGKGRQALLLLAAAGRDVLEGDILVDADIAR